MGCQLLALFKQIEVPPGTLISYLVYLITGVVIPVGSLLSRVVISSTATYVCVCNCVCLCSRAFVFVCMHAVSYTHLTLPRLPQCRSRWSPYH